LLNAISSLGIQLDLGVVLSRQMKKSGLAREMAQQNGGDTGHAADQLDRVINRIIRTLRSGKPARLPGLCTITPGKQWTFQQERNDH
jgi:hypothetical protein